MPTELETALAKESLPPNLPCALPLAHLTAWRWLDAILVNGRLEPRPCRVFGNKLLYFSYGGVFYRTSSPQTEAAGELPVAFVFSPKVMDIVSRLFPFDSGAMHAGRFGSDWSHRLSPFESRFRVDTSGGVQDAQILLYHLFKTNPSYLCGKPSTASRRKHAPLPLLYEFLNADLSSLKVDHRQRTIEAISDVAVELGKNILWVGFPRRKTSDVLKALLRWTRPVIPQFWEYDFHRNYHPAEIAAQLEDHANEDVIKRYAEFKV
jgi:hypothetical protein